MWRLKATDISIERRFPRELSTVFETDAPAAPKGRVVDAALMLRWKLNPRPQVDLGYRILEGGADNKELNTWAKLEGWRSGMGVRF